MSVVSLSDNCRIDIASVSSSCSFSSASSRAGSNCSPQLAHQTMCRPQELAGSSSMGILGKTTRRRNRNKRYFSNSESDSQILKAPDPILKRKSAENTKETEDQKSTRKRRRHSRDDGNLKYKWLVRLSCLKGFKKWI